MYMSAADLQQLAFIGSRWWKGKDDGELVTVTLQFRKPTHRTDEEVVALFGLFMEELGGGYRTRIEVSKP